ncbi:hypothetical protein ADIS_0943 [Lunatimonas lonarensis]|uniref:Uncharacterized protein n=1 Tax=Lunatimonas lonarensis TaxID=1232681 RepID=R7ZX68_9BACT|nr:hypothetical protein ADIS_0943 [Lunatimonas lonarensis]
MGKSGAVFKLSQSKKEGKDRLFSNESILVGKLSEGAVGLA